jgi:hypothetical protein
MILGPKDYKVFLKILILSLLFLGVRWGCLASLAPMFTWIFWPRSITVATIEEEYLPGHSKAIVNGDMQLR